MDAGLKSQIIILVCFICFIQTHLSNLLDTNKPTQKSEITLSKLRQSTLKNIAKRNADWSKRLHSPPDIETPAQIAEESENIEVTSKLPIVVRRMRVQHGGQQHMESLKHTNPESRYSEGGTKVIRVKKFKRKQVKKTTIAPVTTVKTFTPKPTTINSDGTSSSPYSHITVINKEVRNPKKKKNKKKRVNDQYVPTPPYFPEPRQNGRIYVTTSPDMYQARNSYPNFGTINNQNQQSIVYNAETNFQKIKNILEKKENIPPMSKTLSGFEYAISQEQQPISRHQNVKYSIRKSISMKEPKSSVHIPGFTIYSQDNSQQLTASESRHESVKNVSKETEKTENEPNVKTEVPLPTENKSTLQTTVLIADDSTSTIPTNSEQQFVSDKEKVNSPSVRGSNIGSVLRPIKDPIAIISENPKPQQSLFPSRFPSLLHNEKDLFSDPFFDNPGLHSPLHNPSQSPYQLISPMNLNFSPFYQSNDPHIKDHGMYPYHSDTSIVHGFHQSPHITSLRRSILDTYEDDTTTSETVTHFSLPKFEVPQIDFNDKGCQTVYKEVKTIPAQGSQTARNDEKSFVLTRECYFPNGLPTTKPEKEVEMTTSFVTKEPNEKNKDPVNYAD